MHRIEHTTTLKHAVNGGPRDRRRALHALTEGGGDGSGAVLAQHTVFAQRGPGTQDSPLNARRRSIPRKSGLAACEADARQGLAARLRHPVAHRAHAHPQAPGNTAQSFAITYCLNHRQAALFNGAFLAMNNLHKMAQTYPICSGNAETQVFG
jgi:hypothetical protein